MDTQVRFARRGEGNAGDKRMVAERKVRERKKGGKKEKGKKVKRNETNTNCTSRWLPRSPLRVIEYSTSKESCRSTDTHVCRKSAGILLPGNLGTINRSILSLSLSLSGLSLPTSIEFDFILFPSFCHPSSASNRITQLWLILSKIIISRFNF